MSSSTPHHTGVGGCWRALGVLWQGNAYFPVVDLLKRYVHVEEGDDPVPSGEGDGTDFHLGRIPPGDYSGIVVTVGRTSKTVPSSNSIRHNDANEPLTDSNVSWYAKARCSRPVGL